MNLLIWSKDRACQLHLLLSSVAANSKGIKGIYVIWRASSRHFLLSYQKLIAWFPHVSFIEEKSFRDDTLRVLESGHQSILLSTDDTVIFKPVDVSDISLGPHEVLSLRLGLNTLVQNCYTGEVQQPLAKYVKNGDWITWNPLDYHPNQNYGYPGGLDMHGFNREKICSIARAANFSNTNGLESALFGARLNFFSITSPMYSAAVNIPCNNMSQITRAGEFHPYSTEYLNDMYNDDYVIDLDKIMQNRFVGCHQEVPFDMVKYG